MPNHFSLLQVKNEPYTRGKYAFNLEQGAFRTDMTLELTNKDDILKEACITKESTSYSSLLFLYL
jgi:hypothetical protein